MKKKQHPHLVAAYAQPDGLCVHTWYIPERYLANTSREDDRRDVLWIPPLDKPLISAYTEERINDLLPIIRRVLGR
jgi:hypothetical protein